MKLYTELEIRKLLNEILMLSSSVDDSINSLTPIELPSDVDISMIAISWHVYNLTPIEAFKYGAEWTKEQILNQKK